MLNEINTPALALAAGVITSIHCAGMCGPIACALSALKEDESSQIGAAIAYHGGRLISYGVIGAVFGTIGDRFLVSFFQSSTVVLPWFLVIVFTAIAFGYKKKIPLPTFINRWLTRLRFKALRLSATRGSMIMGLATPALPCAPLYLLFAACFATGSPLRGAEFALAFGIGTTPLLWATQLSIQKLQLRLGNKWIPRLRKGLALTAAIIMAWRLQDTIPLINSNHATEIIEPAVREKDESSKLPSCCH